MGSNNTDEEAAGVAGGEIDRPPSDYPLPLVLSAREVLIWDEDGSPEQNYPALGRRLAAAGDLFRLAGHDGGLLLATTAPGVPPKPVSDAMALAPVVVDRVPVRVVKAGRATGSRISNGHFGTMLRSELFLQQFRPVDSVSRQPVYLPDFSATRPGYNDGGPGFRVFYTGEIPALAADTPALTAFLDAMPFATNADRTNAVAAALTVMLRNHWPGGKPLVCVTANKSHAGKDTVVTFAAGCGRVTPIPYESTDWAFRNSFVAAVKHHPDTAVLNVENARLDRGSTIRSGFLEAFITGPEPVLSSPGRGRAVGGRNDLVVSVTTNFGSVSTDLMNRSLPIHLELAGNIEDRPCPIGNPREEYLPANREQIAAELRGMIERWRRAGGPLDERVRHPFKAWARTVGGILSANGFTDFLANYGTRKAADDPLRRGLGLVGAFRPDEWLSAGEWAEVAASLGLVKVVVPEADRDSGKGRERGMGVVLSAHRGEVFRARPTTGVWSCGWGRPAGGSAPEASRPPATASPPRAARTFPKTGAKRATDGPSYHEVPTARAGARSSAGRAGERVPSDSSRPLPSNARDAFQTGIGRCVADVIKKAHKMTSSINGVSPIPIRLPTRPHVLR